MSGFVWAAIDETRDTLQAPGDVDLGCTYLWCVSM